MKIATKIAVGYGVLIALLLAVLVYQLAVISQSQRLHENLSSINMRASILAVQLLRDLDQVEEFTQKFFVTADPGYAEQVVQTRDAFSQILQEIRSLRLSPGEAEQVERLAQLWAQLGEPAPPPERRSTPEELRQFQTVQAEQLAQVSRLRLQTLRFMQATRLAIGSQIEESARASQSAQRVSWAAAVAALLVSLAVSFWIVRSISKPLGRLTDATRAVAQGQFSYRLDIAGRDELAQLARDFDTMTRRLNELDEMKKDFVSHVSHELKSPLASIHETIRLLLDQIPGPLSSDQRRLLELSLQSGRRLSSMIGNLLDLSRIEAGVMEYERKQHDLADLVRTALAEFAVQLPEKNLRVEAQLPAGPVPVRCDGDRIHQVVGNLIGNAWKFSPVGGAIRVSLCPVAEMPGNVPQSWRGKIAAPSGGTGFAVVSVADAGPGVPDSEKEKIFEKFHQVHTARSSKTASPQARPSTKLAGQGVGLGLAIARTIVEAHRGAIWVEDNPGGGSVFYILLAAGSDKSSDK